MNVGVIYTADGNTVKVLTGAPLNPISGHCPSSLCLVRVMASNT